LSLCTQIISKTLRRGSTQCGARFPTRPQGNVGSECSWEWRLSRWACNRIEWLLLAGQRAVYCYWQRATPKTGGKKARVPWQKPPSTKQPGSCPLAATSAHLGTSDLARCWRTWARHRRVFARARRKIAPAWCNLKSRSLGPRCTRCLNRSVDLQWLSGLDQCMSALRSRCDYRHIGRLGRRPFAGASVFHRVRRPFASGY
jgi:hypothetical protein